MMIKVEPKLDFASEGRKVGQRSNEWKKMLILVFTDEMYAIYCSRLRWNVALILFNILKELCFDSLLFVFFMEFRNRKQKSLISA